MPRGFTFGNGTVVAYPVCGIQVAGGHGFGLVKPLDVVCVIGGVITEFAPAAKKGVTP